MSADSNQGEGVQALARSCDPFAPDLSAMSAAESRRSAAVRALIRSRESSGGVHDPEQPAATPAKEAYYTTYFPQGEQRVVKGLVMRHQAHLIVKEPELVQKKERPLAHSLQPNGTSSTDSRVKALIKRREIVMREPPALPPVKEVEIKGVQALIRKRESRVKALIMKREHV